MVSSYSLKTPPGFAGGSPQRMRRIVRTVRTRVNTRSPRSALRPGPCLRHPRRSLGWRRDAAGSRWRRRSLGREIDRELIRSLARHLAEDGSQAERLRTIIRNDTSSQALTSSEIVDAIRNSPSSAPTSLPDYNAVRPRGRLEFRRPDLETIVPPGWPPGSAEFRRTASLVDEPSMD